MCSVRFCGNYLSGSRGNVKIERTDKKTLRTDYKVNSYFFGVRLRKRLCGCRGGVNLERNNKNALRTDYKVSPGPGEQVMQKGKETQ